MKHYTLFLAALLIILTTAFVSAAPGSLLFVVQQDLNPSINSLAFEKGMKDLLKRVPPETAVSIYKTSKNNTMLAAQGTAEKLSWLPGGKGFTLRNPATTPYQNLLAFLEKERIQDRTVIWVTSGIAEDLKLQFEDRRPGTIIPTDFGPLEKLVSYCRANRVRLTTFIVGGGRGPLGRERDPGFICLQYAARETGGEFYYNYVTFGSVFPEALKKGALGL